MKTLKKYKLTKSPYKFALNIAGFLLALSFAVASPAFAAGVCDDPSATAQQAKDAKCCDKKNPSNTSIENCVKTNPIIKQVRNIVNFLSAGVGIVIIGSIIWGGIQYSMAGNNPNAVSAAKDRIQDSLIALLAFFFIFAFLQWLIPGGLLKDLIK